MNRLLVVGDVVDDVIVRPRGATSVASDTEAQIERHPGGSGANVAAWAGSAGADVCFVGRTGAADVRRHADSLAACGVDARIVAAPARHTAALVALVDAAGERTMYVDRGANALLSAVDVDDAWDEGIGWLHLTGYSFFCSESRPAALDLLERAQRCGVPVSVDPSSAGFLERSGRAFLDWVAGAELLLPNLDEALVLTGAADPLVAAQALLAYVPEVIVTCGVDGAMRVGRDGDTIRQPAIPVQVLDSTGAGDAFCAGTLAARSQGRDVHEQLRRGAELAAACVTRLGARPC
jgi:sugar/nucleoside kinase (ribokinase family)